MCLFAYVMVGGLTSPVRGSGRRIVPLLVPCNKGIDYLCRFIRKL